MQKTLLYLSIVAILGFGVWYFLFNDRRAGEGSFTVNDTAGIGKIFLAPNNSEHTITLERRGSGWIVNNEYPVLQSSLNQLLTTIHNQRSLHPVTDNQRDAVVRSLIGSGVKVEIYDREGRQMRSFYVGNETSRFSGTVMIEAGSERPFVVQIPGFEGYLTPRYTADLAVWRDRAVFAYEPGDIEEVQVQYPGRPEDSFTMLDHDGKLDVRLDPSVRTHMPLNERRVRSYLNFYRMLYLENYQSYRGLDTIIRNMPELATVRVKGSGGRETTVRFLYAPMEERGHNAVSEYAENNIYSNERYYAIMNGGKDTATVQIQMFEKLFRKGSEFYMADEKPRFDIPGLNKK